MYALTEAISELLDEPIVERSVNAMLRCPLHDDSSPSFSIHLDEGVWHCFGCEESGNIDKLYRLLGKEVDYEVRMVQAKRRAEDPEVYTHDFSALANSYVRGLRSKRAQGFLRDYCEPRGISEDVIRAFSVGYDAERDALAFPYVDTEGRVTGIKYRYRGGFKASEPGSVYGMFGVDHAVGRERVIICEGETDTISTLSKLRELDRGSLGVAGTSGASVSEALWARFALSLIFARTIYLAYDADDPGDECADRAMRVLGNDKCVRVRPTRGKDITEHYQAGGSLEELGL